LESAGSGRAARVIMVSLAKSGTHLLQELMLALGYKMFSERVSRYPAMAGPMAAPVAVAGT
jgi:hypothetical protein